jgi:predicted AAA+ superfamily ATPase
MAFRDFNRMGGMPEIALTESLSLKYKKLQGYFDTMLLKDFIEHFGVKQPQVLRFFLKRAMAGIANPLSVNAIYGEIRARGMKIAKDELYGWLQEACDIYLLQRLPRFSRSFAKQEAALAKYYVIDNGIRNAVIPLQSDDEGKQLENTIYLELLRRRGGNETLSFWQERGECDFVVSEDEKVRRLVQVTWNMNEDSLAGRKTRKREIDGLVAAAESLGCEDLTIVTRDEESSVTERGHSIRIVPAWKWCLSR